MSNKACPKCGGKLVTRAETIEVDVAGVKVRDGGLMLPVCEKCGEYVISEEDLAETERRAALTVLGEVAGPSGKMLKFARKAIGLRQGDLARALGVAPETVSRWEANEHIDRTVSLAMAQLLTLKETDPRLLKELSGTEADDEGPSAPTPAPEPGPRQKRVATG